MSPINPEINIELDVKSTPTVAAVRDLIRRISIRTEKRSPLDCPFYEEHSGKYYQGCWEHNDLCWLGPYLSSLSCRCHTDCWYFTGDPRLIMNVLLREYRQTENFVKKMGILTALNDVLETSVKNWRQERERCYR